MRQATHLYILPIISELDDIAIYVLLISSVDVNVGVLHFPRFSSVASECCSCWSEFNLFK
jgi:hypothetical protein